MAPVSTEGRAVSPLLGGLVCVLAGAALACGETLVDETYSGTPLFTVRGKVVAPADYVDEEDAEVFLALLWSRGDAEKGDRLVEQPGTVHRTAFFRSYVLHLFDEPGSEHFFTTPSGARYAIGRLAGFQDENGNGRRDASEPFGGFSPQAVLRAPEALSARDSPTGTPLSAGWHIVSTPLACPPATGPQPAPDPTAPVADGECGVPLGAGCKRDSDCGGGVCVLNFIGEWNGGACLIPEPPPNGCRQRGSVLLRGSASDTRAYWIPACSTSEDCGRLHPYQCDQQLRGCRPSAEVVVDINGREAQRSFCAGQGGQPPPQ
ncbi:hypothetical protein ACN28I_39365 [Archangium gephyra]|uniref:hypothetical protein n=1 Tax=Archangium gephyra TaxID=48 RepID=UPI003B804BF8